MKNSKGETLKQPYLALAEMRRAQKPQSAACMDFTWSLTPEGDEFWGRVWRGVSLPDIPAASLAELEAWQKQREESKQSDFWGMAAMVADELRPEPDYKAMYFQSQMEMGYYKDLYEQKCIDFNGQTDSRNWVAECAMAIVAFNSEITSTSWDYAEAWAAEGRKRGHLPKTDNA